MNGVRSLLQLNCVLHQRTKQLFVQRATLLRHGYTPVSYVRSFSTSPPEDRFAHLKEKFDTVSISCLKERGTGEKRVAQTPNTVKQLVQRGLQVYVESNAGAAAQFSNLEYEKAGAKIIESLDELYNTDIVLKVNPPSQDEIKFIETEKPSTFFSFLDPTAHMAILEELKLKKKINYVSMNCIPRITRSQVFDALSSMSNIAGYRAIVEASNEFGRFFSGQMTAAGRIPPAKVLIIGGGIAGLSAAVTAKNLGAIVRCFDTRPAVKEQVESLGAEFLLLPGFELSEGAGGYAKAMSQEFYDAEMKLFAEQCKDVDIVITTALIPGRKAPILITKEMVESMKPGSVIVDLAAPAGGNVETIKPGCKYVDERNVTQIGYTDFPSRLPSQASTLFSNNVTKLVMAMIEKQEGTSSLKLNIDFADEVTRGSTVLFQGQVTWPAPLKQQPQPKPSSKRESAQNAAAKRETSLEERTIKDATVTATVTSGLVATNMLSTDPAFLALTSMSALSGYVGYKAVYNVTPALHTPLMSVTNAISGSTVFGGLLLLGHANPVATALTNVAILASMINVAGGFTITKRMLDLFKRPEDPVQYNKYYVIPGLATAGTFFLGTYLGFPSMEYMVYLVSSLCCVNAISALSAQKTAQYGNVMGMLGVGTALVTSVATLPTTSIPAACGLMAAGSGLGVALGHKIGVTQLPQTVAAFHSLVGLAAMLTSISHYMIHPEAALVQKVAAMIGNIIGGVTLTGSLVAFGKLQQLLPSEPLRLPMKNTLNLGLLGAQAAAAVAFATTTSATMGTNLLIGTAAMSMVMGAHLVGSVGGADMPVCITVLNSYSGWALLAESFMLNNPMLAVVGSLIGFSGGILSKIMCDAMNRSLPNVLFGGYSTPAKVKSSANADGPEKRKHREISINETIDSLMLAQNIIVVPGYGLAVAQAQHCLAELSKILIDNGRNVRFGIHPVAGRMPGQLNVLLAESGISYDRVFDLEDINNDFSETDVALVIGANDITNSASEEIPDSPISGMPVLKVWNAKQCIYIKRSMASGYADIDNPVFYKECTNILMGDAKDVTEALCKELKQRLM